MLAGVWYILFVIKRFVPKTRTVTPLMNLFWTNLNLYVSAGDYFSLSRLAASYKFKFDQKIFIKGVTVRVFGTNLFMTNKMYQTPASIMAGVSINL